MESDGILVFLYLFTIVLRLSTFIVKVVVIDHFRSPRAPGRSYTIVSNRETVAHSYAINFQSDDKNDRKRVTSQYEELKLNSALTMSIFEQGGSPNLRSHDEEYVHVPS